MTAHRCTRFRELYEELEDIKAGLADPHNTGRQRSIDGGQLLRQTRLITTHLQRCKECS